MLNKTIYLKLKESFSNVASWAVWGEPTSDKPKSNMRTVSMFDNDDILNLLNPNFVFIGLNGSGVHDDYMDIAKPWHNFHSSNPRGHDYKLRYALKGTPYWGAYITDAIKELPEVDSVKVTAFLKNHPNIVAQNMDILKKEIEILGTKPTLICLGEKSYELVKRHLGNQFNVKKIIHYSYQIGKEDYRSYVLNALSCDDHEVDISQNANSTQLDSIPEISIKPVTPSTICKLEMAENMPSLEKHLKLNELDMPQNWVGDNRDKLLSLLEPIIRGTDFSIRKNLTDTTKNGLNLFYKNEPRRCMGFGKIKNMGILIYPTTSFYEEILNKVKLHEPDPKKSQPHIKMTLIEFWEMLYKITR